MKNKNKKVDPEQGRKVFVGVSGGVDSSVSLALLKAATPNNYEKLFGRPTPKGFRGYDVVGVFIRTWTPDFIECTWRDERRDAMRVCAHLDVPFLECDAEKEYKQGVADYMIAEYKRGRVPNPDVMCNREVKFGVFWRFAQRHGADFIATGHYAQVSRKLKVESKKSGVKNYKNKKLDKLDTLYKLLTGRDSAKDQSYFLWTLTEEDLARTLFPIGHLAKSQVRKLAEKFGLPTATKKDSQGVCFLGPLDMKEFLKHYIKSKKGNVENTKGEVIGHHDGALFFTLGERHGFNIDKKTASDKPYFVVAKDIKRNVLVVSENKNEFKKDSAEIKLGSVVVRGELHVGRKYEAQIRYHGELLPVKILACQKGTMTLKFLKFDPSISPGQSVVIYDGAVCLAGGVVL